METRIIVDSCVDFNSEVFGQEDYMERIPFKIIIDGEEIIDKNLDTSLLLEKMKNSKNKIATACPSPHEFLEALKKCKNNFVVTISEKLSGSHNSAMLAKEMLKEESPDSFVHVFDCKTAVSGARFSCFKDKTINRRKST